MIKLLTLIQPQTKYFIHNLQIGDCSLVTVQGDDYYYPGDKVRLRNRKCCILFNFFPLKSWRWLFEIDYVKNEYLDIHLPSMEILIDHLQSNYWKNSQ